MSAEYQYWQLDLDEDLTRIINPALNYLSKDEDGFVLMVEQAHIDKHSHSNDISGAMRCVQNLNDTVNMILEWIGDRNDTAIIITADHETGYLEVSKDADYLYNYSLEEGNLLHYFFGTTGHSATEVGVFIHGYTPDFTKYLMSGSTSIIKNTAVYQIIIDLINEPMRT